MSVKGKYIIMKIRGVEVAILFHSLINHCDIGTCKDSRGETVSAGFFEVGTACNQEECGTGSVSVGVWGRSDSLDLDSRPEDGPLIETILNTD